ncbi:MAG: hypothetical protein QOJ19_4267, partial [Acidimicrobiia bacterium]|nr:hypothetical protein [Acidimicrobiia bacterium]
MWPAACFVAGNGMTCDGGAVGIPVYLTRLIGRRRDLEALEQRLLEGRLITLVGPGGVGKSRLAVEAARRWNERFDDGVIFASLVDVSTGDEAAAVVAAEADVDSRPGSALIDGLIERFAGNQTLVVLDNLEHLAPHAAQLVNGLLAAEGITILGTSRAPLGIPGEIVLRVEPLPHPIAGAAVADALASPAIELLIDRLRASRPERTVSDDDLAELVMIAQAVEGLPLGLELAAARADVLDLQELRRLAGWSTLALGTSATSVAERHRSLRSAIEWSVRLLSEPARDLVMRCGLLAGGATLDLLAELSRRTSPETLSIVDELVRASLLQRTVGRSTRTRYRLLEPVRQFQAEELTDKGLGREVRQSILNHCVAIAHRVDALDGTAEGWTAADELGDDYWNAVASVRWALTNDEISDHVIDLLLTMYVPIIKGKRGFANELARLYVGLLDSGKASERHRLRLARRGTLLYLETGQHELAHELSDRGVELAVATGDDLALADAREVVGVVRLYQGHLDEAERHFNECEPIIQRSGPAWRRAQVRGGRAIMARHRGHLEEAVAIAQGPRDAGDANLHHVYQALDVSIAEALSAQGRWQEALSRTSEVTAWAERYDNRHLLEEATLAAFDAHLGAGELAEADDRLANLSLDTRHASLGVVIGYQTRRARLAALSGDLTAAWLAADEAVNHARALGWGEEMAQALATLGQVALASNDL